MYDVIDNSKKVMTIVGDMVWELQHCKLLEMSQEFNSNESKLRDNANKVAHNYNIFWID